MTVAGAAVATGLGRLALEWLDSGAEESGRIVR